MSVRPGGASALLSLEAIGVPLLLRARSSPAVYRLYVRLRRGGRTRLPLPDDDLHITGLPRSGNTFAIGLIERLMPELRVSSHLHVLASLRIALRHGVPTVVLFRDPADALASWMIKSRTEGGVGPHGAGRYVREYTAYYGWVEAHAASLHLLAFDRLVGDPASLLRVLEEALARPLPGVADAQLDAAVAGAVRALRSDPRQPATNAWRSPEKEALKRRALDEIRAAPGWPDTVALHGRLLAAAAAGRNPLAPPTLSAPTRSRG